MWMHVHCALACGTCPSGDGGDGDTSGDGGDTSGDGGDTSGDGGDGDTSGDGGDGGKNDVSRRNITAAHWCHTRNKMVCIRTNYVPFTLQTEELEYS